MTKELSALFDGELEAHEAPALWAAIRSDRTLRHRWSEYQLIRDAVRREGALGTDFAERVMEGIAAEPTVLAPRPASRRSVRPSVPMALAASVTGVAVVGWLAFATMTGQPDATVTVARISVPTAPAPIPARRIPAAVPASAQTLATLPAKEPQAAPDYRHYLLAHQANATGLYLPGGTQHIRTVASLGAGQ